MEVPASLRRWFVVHFVADVVFALPLLFAPRAFLTALGWTEVDPISARLVGAALMGIGVQSLLGRDETLEAFRGMLNLKIIWSATATVGIAVSVLQGGPKMGWAFVGIFAAFNALWTTYRVRLRRA
jgi:hypothetical protein